MRLYLAGPMRGRALNNAPAFHAAAAWLRFLGHEVWSPAEQDDAFDAAPERATFERDLTTLFGCEGVALLPDWASSAGACLERHAADVAGIPVYIVADDLVLLKPRDWRIVRTPIGQA